MVFWDSNSTLLISVSISFSFRFTFSFVFFSLSVSFCSLLFRHGSVFYGFRIRFRSFRFHFFQFLIPSIFCSPLLCPVPSAFRPAPYSFCPVCFPSGPVSTPFHSVSLFPFCVPFRFRLCSFGFSFRTPFFLFPVRFPCVSGCSRSVSFSVSFVSFLFASVSIPSQFLSR